MRTKTRTRQRSPAPDQQGLAQGQYRCWLWQVQRKTSRSTARDHRAPAAMSTAQAQAEAETLVHDAPPLGRVEDPTPLQATAEGFLRHPERDSLQRSPHAEMAGSAVGQRSRRTRLDQPVADPESEPAALGDPRWPFVHRRAPTHQSWAS